MTKSKRLSSSLALIDLKASFTRQVVEVFGIAGSELILRALAFAEWAHSQQTRDDGSPYVLHPLRVANSLINELGITDCQIISAALLHDVLEDTPVKEVTVYRLR